MPKIPDISSMPTLEQALAAIVSSIAMEEVAISHVLTAESEKIRYVIEHAKTSNCGCTDLPCILEVNKSVADLIKQINAFQALLKEKLAIVSKHIQVKPKPCPPCTSIFTTDADYYWHKSMTMFLQESKGCNNGVQLQRKGCETLIQLPHGKEIEVQFELKAQNTAQCPVVINIEFRRGNNVARRETLSHKAADRVCISHNVKYITPCDGPDNFIAIRLVAPDTLSCVNAKVTVDTDSK